METTMEIMETTAAIAVSAVRKRETILATKGKEECRCLTTTIPHAPNLKDFPTVTILNNSDTIKPLK